MLKLPDDIDAILFDWDGTLSDSVPLVTRATNEILAAHGYAAVTEAQIHDGMRFPTAERLLYHMGLLGADAAEGLGAAPASGVGQGAPGDALLARARAMADEFYEAADRLGHRHVALFPGVLEMIEALDADGVPMAVVTNNRRSTASALIRHAGLPASLAIVVGEEDVSRPKPDPEGVFLAVAALERRDGRSIAPERTVFVGDSHSDAGAATASGTIGVGAGWPPDSIVHRPDNPYELVCRRTEDFVAAVRGGEAA
ncbi:MAG: HAD family hydrolase [Spirochaetota bacterium]